MPPKSPPFYKNGAKMGGFFHAVPCPHTPFLEVTALNIAYLVLVDEFVHHLPDHLLLFQEFLFSLNLSGQFLQVPVYHLNSNS